VCLGMIAVLLYCGSDWQAQSSFVAWAHALPDGRLARSMTWLAEHLCIFSNGAEGIIRQVKHNIRGHGAYLLGDAQPRAFWYYFPVALSIKLSLPLLFLPFVVAVVRPRALVNWASLAAATLLLFSLNCRVQIGVRLMLPLVALAIVGLAAATVQLCRTLPDSEKPSILRRRLVA